MKKILKVLCVVGIVFWTRSFWLPTVIEFTTDVMGVSTTVKDEIKKPALKEPENQTFALRNVEIGQSKAEVEKTLGKAKRQTTNEFGLTWTTYHTDYHNFIMVMYDEENLVQGLYSNQDLLSSTDKLDFSSKRSEVQKILGQSLTKMYYQDFYMNIDSKEQYDVYRLDGNYVTFFYDTHEDNKVTAVQIVAAKLEEEKTAPYRAASSALRTGFEYQLFDLTNSERVKRDLSALDFNQSVRTTARNHSADMAENNYFDHTDLKGKTPFDRLSEDHISYRSAGENIGQGQTSSIFVHQGLMNSSGHRKNILYEDYDEMGVGVAFNEENAPYYTENFIGK